MRLSCKGAISVFSCELRCEEHSRVVQITAQGRAGQGRAGQGRIQQAVSGHLP